MGCEAQNFSFPKNASYPAPRLVIAATFFEASGDGFQQTRKYYIYVLYYIFCSYFSLLFTENVVK